MADYRLGVDLGTTFTAAAVERAGRVEPVPLGGSHGTAIPSVVHLAGDRMNVGVDAARRATTEPGRVIREFKRRVGDATPYVVDGRPVTADALMARLVSWVVGQVTATEGGPPQALAVTHPANWGEHKRQLLRAAIESEAVRPDRLVPEPVAAAHYYAAQRRLASGSVVAVYDLGGGTFDAAVIQVDGEGACTIRGRPDGIERLGGIDFDEAVFGHVLRALGVDPDGLDPDDLAMVAAVAGLRRSCVEAKEALSEATEVAIPVLLPERHTQVPLRRVELEAMIRPALDETIVALRRAIDAADVTADDLTAVLLVGGSSRIPLVEQLVTAETGRPVATDARPKDAISMGAAFVAAQVDPAPTPPPPVGPAVGSTPVVTTGSTPVVTTGPTPPWPTVPPRPRRRLVPLLVSLVLVVAAVAIGVALAGRDSDETEARPTATTEATDTAGATGTTAAGAIVDDAPGGDGRATPTHRPIAETYDLSGVTMSLGWLDLTDQFLLANITAEAVEEAGATVRADGPTMAVGVQALRAQLGDGDIDLYWDYLGSPGGIDLSDLPFGISAQDRHDRLNELDAASGLVWLEPTAFTRDTGLAVRRQVAEELEISSIADIAHLVAEDPTAASVCFVLEDRLRSVEASYGFRFTRAVTMSTPDDAYERLAEGDCTFAEVPHAVHPAMADRGLMVLDDNRNWFLPMNAAPRVRADFLNEHPEIEDMLAQIARTLDNDTMSMLVARVELDGEVAADVAHDWLSDNGFIG